MDDLHQLFRGLCARIVVRQRAIDEMLANMILDHFGDESVHRPTTGGGLLQDAGTLLLLLNRSLDRLDLAPDPLQTIEQLRLLSLNMRHLLPFAPLDNSMGEYSSATRHMRVPRLS